MTEAEYIQAQEESELQELIASMEDDNQDTTSQHYGSDDDDYDQIFMECTVSENIVPQQQRHFESPNRSFDDVDAMDMS